LADVRCIRRGEHDPNGRYHENPIEHAESRPCVVPPQFMDSKTIVETPEGDEGRQGTENAGQNWKNNVN
jgi:hypothetical protein